MIKMEKQEELIGGEPNEDESTNLFEFKCRMCRGILFTSNDLTQHTAGENDLKKRGYRADGCSSYFLTTSPTWFTPSEDVTGKLCCVKCDAKLGQWSWSGNQCSCGAWITPAFQFNKSKVDACEVKPNQVV